MFISYAQNFEDVILNRVFKDKKTGFYIDVGANHPINDSVTRAFYQRGWRGINIEPMKKEFELLEKERPLDINLNVAISDQSTEGTKQLFFDLQGTGLSTLDSAIAHRVGQERQLSIESYEVPVHSLASICRKWIKEPIDFLKIDVEGWEEAVIKSHDWENFRPTVLVIETTIPGKAEYFHSNIPTLLKAAKYQKVYFDGLNDFYLANESLDLKKYFCLPPNIFDNFQPFRYWDKKLHADKLKEMINQRDLEIEELNAYCSALNEKLMNEQTEVEYLRNSLQKNGVLYNQQIESFNQAIQKSISSLENLDVINKKLNIEVEELRKRIVLMESSKFWKLRRIWFWIKQKASSK